MIEELPQRRRRVGAARLLAVYSIQGLQHQTSTHTASTAANAVESSMLQQPLLMVSSTSEAEASSSGSNTSNCCNHTSSSSSSKGVPDIEKVVQGSPDKPTSVLPP